MSDLEALARPGDPETSQEAAETISPHLRELQAAVLRFAFENPDGFNHVELNEHFGTTSSTYRTRCSELVDKGYIRDSGVRDIIGGRRRHVVWVITPSGAAAHRAA